MHTIPARAAVVLALIAADTAFLLGTAPIQTIRIDCVVGSKAVIPAAFATVHKTLVTAALAASQHHDGVRR